MLNPSLNLKLEPKSALLYREDTYDLEVIKEVWTCYKYLSIGEDDVVLDLGGNIGAFTAICAGAARKVITVEPEPENFHILSRNLASDERVAKLNVAAVADDRKEVTLFLNGQKNKGSHSMIVEGGRAGITVPALHISKIYSEYRPTVVKMDIEGMEYELIRKADFNKEVQQVAVEFHYSRKDYKAFLPEARAAMARQGFEEVVPFNITDSAWHKIAFYAR